MKTKPLSIFVLPMVSLHICETKQCSKIYKDGDAERDKQNYQLLIFASQFCWAL